MSLSIYFPRYQRAFRRISNVGSHPQFRHLAHPPSGYRFESTPIGWWEWLQLAPRHAYLSATRLLATYRFCREHGLGWREALRFHMDRGLSRLVPAPASCRASFLPTFPLSMQNESWFVEIEDIITLFRPYVRNGETRDIRFRQLTMFPLIQNLLESASCKGILTHVESTKRSISQLFNSPVIDQKTKHIPAAYVPVLPITESELEERRSSNEVRFFFNNSWHQNRMNFYVRGGISIFEAFSGLLDTDLPVRLVIRSRLPRHLPREMRRLLDHPKVEFVPGFQQPAQFIELLRSCHYFLLPAARLHVISLLEAMYYGAVPIVSDGWGIGEYVQDGVSGHVLRGIEGRVSWIDRETGELREDYAPMQHSPGLLSAGLKDLIVKVVKQPQGRAQMALNAHRRVTAQHGLEGFNEQFKRFLDDGLSSVTHS